MTDRTQREITELLLAWRGGEEKALAELIPQVYGQLQEMASNYLRQERVDHTLQTTDLVHEAFVRVVQLERIDWVDRAHFLALVARFMRRILVDHARTRSRIKRGSNAIRIPLEDLEGLAPPREAQILELDEALKELSEKDEEASKVVEMRFFGGLNRDEIAEVLGISSATVTRRWRMARAWLFHSLEAGSPA